jgi:hypothetical protein
MIFNKTGNGSTEAKELLGFIYQSNSFDNLITYISIAERDIKRVIGPEVFTLADDHYHSDSYHTEPDEQIKPDPQLVLLDELVRLIQLPVMLHAYRRYAPLNDLSHSESGRQITVTNELKPAFEWMLERDNKSLLDIAHETTDMLLEFLDEQQPIADDVIDGQPLPQPMANIIEDTWKASETYSATKSLFINSAREFDSVFPINASRRLYLVLVPFIREVEIRHIRPAIKSDRYNTIREMIKDSDLTTAGNEEEKEIHELSKVPIALLTISVALKRLSVELLPDSVVQSFAAMDVKQTKTANPADRVGVSAVLERDARRMLTDLQDYITSLLPVVTVVEDEIDTTQPFFMS